MYLLILISINISEINFCFGTFIYEKTHVNQRKCWQVNSQEISLGKYALNPVKLKTLNVSAYSESSSC